MRYRALFTHAAVAALLAGFAHPAAAQTPVATPRFEPADPSVTRLSLMPTARTLPAGAVSLTLVDILLPIVQVGITDRLSIGVGTIPIVSDPPIVVMPKVQVYRGASTQGAVGVLHVTGTSDVSMGLAYGVVTHGTDDRSFTAGGGWVYARGEDESGRLPVAIFGAENRLSGRTKFIGDVLILGDVSVINAGLRLIRKKFAADFSLVVLAGSGAALPGLTISLGWRF